MLDELDDQVRALDLALIEKRSGERRAAILILTYSSLFYLLMLLYVFFYPWRHTQFEDLQYQRMVDATALLGYPVAVWALRRIVVWVYRRRIVSLESRLKMARTQQKLKIEELKKQTAYYQTKGLLERFDPDFTKQSSTPQVKKADPKVNKTVPMPTASPTTIVQHVAIPTWFDRVMDSLIGDDRMSKYALICPRCHTHNGLVRPEDYDTVQYTCPNCKLYVPPRKPTSPSASLLGSASDISTIPDVSSATVSTIGDNDSSALAGSEGIILTEDDESVIALPDLSSPDLTEDKPASPVGSTNSKGSHRKTK